jgi:hypothetical protein
MNGPNKKPITISLDNLGKIKVTPDSQPLSPNDEAAWQTDPPGTKFQVKFKDKTPFAKGDFDESNPNSGKPTVKVTEPTPYKYEVHYKNDVLDPDVIIKPN